MFAVLIVDDHRHLVENLATTIPWGKLGFSRVYSAFSGPEALERIGSASIHLLLTDIRMPGMSGLQLIELAREMHPHMGCVLLTGYSDFDYARKAIELQAFRYLLKPVRQSELISCVEELTPLLRVRYPDADKEESDSGVDADERSESEKRPGHHKLIVDVQRYIRDRIGDDVSLNAIAEHVYLHPVYLSKVYKEATGTNLSEFILSSRIERAKELLRESPLRIYEIGKAVGYRSSQHFIQEFRKAVGLTPKRFRDM